ncbi:MAG: DNA polymerase III subunit beta [Desulfurellaceae bacterium]|nr:DNA polymerase III subunit beta [Desulfurellaceae bacterium]
MECLVEKDELLRCLYLVQGVVEKRSSLPILAHVLIESNGEQAEAEDTALSLRATDLEIGIRQHCRAQVKKRGSITTDARKLYEIVRELPSVGGSSSDPTVIVLRSAGSGWVEVSSGKSRFRMASLDPKEFPAIVQDEADGASLSPASCPSEVLREMIEKTLFATSPDETRLNLSGVYVEALDSGKLRMVASDGHRLSLIERQATITEPAAWPKVILPRKGLLEARKILERGEGEASFSLQATTAGLRKEATALSMRLVEGEFPDYQQILPTEHNFLIAFSREELLSALRRLLILTTERSRGIKLQIEAGKVEISVNTPDLGEGVEEIATDYSGENIAVGFNGRYLVEALTVMEEGQQITLSLKDDMSPGLLRTVKDQDFSYVIMPMRIF